MLTHPIDAADVPAQTSPLCSGPDRRRHTRLAFDCPVRWRARKTETDGAGSKSRKRSAGHDRIGWARDAGESGVGLMVRTDSMPAVGDRIEVVFQLDNYCDLPIGQDAVVRWTQPIGDGLCNLGIELAQSQEVGQPTAVDLRLRSLIRGLIIGGADIPTA